MLRADMHPTTSIGRTKKMSCRPVSANTARPTSATENKGQPPATLRAVSDSEGARCSLTNSAWGKKAGSTQKWTPETGQCVK